MLQLAFHLDETSKTPEIHGDLDTGELILKGVSVPEDAKDFYYPLKNWVLELLQSNNDSIKITIDLDYFNTSTSSILLNFFKLFQRAAESKEVTVLWIYEEDDYEMEEVGKDYQLMIGDIFKLEMRPV